MRQPRSLASRIVHLEAAEFVGRRCELLAADAILAGDVDTSVLFIHGPAGVGKSRLAREIRRRAGREVTLIDDHTAEQGPELRRQLATLPSDAVVVIAGREEPDAGWFKDGWDTVMLRLRLAPLSPAQSHALLERLGFEDERENLIVEWAGGLPRRLRQAATAAQADPDWRPSLQLDAVRDALRTLHRPGACTIPRERLEEAARRAFGETPDEQLLRQVLLRGYVDPAGSHEAAARELHLSRAAYFRRLRSASERVADYLVRAAS